MLDLSSLVTIGVGGVVTMTISAVGWSLLRNVKGFDDSIISVKQSVENTSDSIEGLRSELREELTVLKNQISKMLETDTRVQVEIANIHARVAYLEYLVMGAARHPTGEYAKVLEDAIARKKGE